MDEKEENSLNNNILGESFANYQTNDTTNNENQKSFLNNESIIMSDNLDNYHIECPKCHHFFSIEFTENKTSIKITCLCYNNKEISIKDFFGIIINDSSDTSSIGFNNYEGLKCNCIKNNFFKSYCITCRLNKCTGCVYICLNKSHEFIDLKERYWNR